MTHNSTIGKALAYSIVETAKANNLNTYQYLELFFTELPKYAEDKNLQFLDTLLPWSDRVQKECPSKYKNHKFQGTIKYIYNTSQPLQKCGVF